MLEVRLESWLQPQAIALLKEYKIGFVISQSGSVFLYAEFITSKHIYLRFHGPAVLYSGYKVEMLHTHAIYDTQKLRSFTEQKKPV